MLEMDDTLGDLKVRRRSTERVADLFRGDPKKSQVIQSSYRRTNKRMSR